ncbi:MAG: diaminopimelate epimerase [Kiritimatiellia bacterium]|nr:diaminopimelate epimerase [Lentisphaerota bacterium]
MKTIEFWKMHGAGNDFIMLVDRDGSLSRPAASRIRELCHRPAGIGAQGLLILRPLGQDVVRMRFYNPDGRTAPMCGNGARCTAQLAFDRRLAARKMTLRTGAGPVRAEVLPKGVRIELPPPRHWTEMRVKAGGRDWECHCVDTGVPHAVLLVKDVNRIDVCRFGAALRHHRAFAPRGVNVDFMDCVAGGVLRVRTYERGVEDETGACGTGIAACALIAGRLGLVQPPVKLVCRYGDSLMVDYQLTERGAGGLRLTGPVKYVFTGRVAW